MRMSALGSRLRLLGLASLGFILYTIINHLPWNAMVAHQIPTGLDGVIPLIPVFSIPYGLAMLVVIGTLIHIVMFSGRIEEARACSYAYAFCLLVSCLTYLLFQTTVERPVVEAGDPFLVLVAFVYANDRPYNCFPSLHVSLTVIASLLWAERRPRLRPVLFAWVVLVALSTLFMKQHYVADVLAGALLGGASHRFGARLARS